MAQRFTHALSALEQPASSTSTGAAEVMPRLNVPEAIAQHRAVQPATDAYNALVTEQADARVELSAAKRALPIAREADKSAYATALAADARSKDPGEKETEKAQREPPSRASRRRAQRGCRGPTRVAQATRATRYADGRRGVQRRVPRRGAGRVGVSGRVADHEVAHVADEALHLRVVVLLVLPVRRAVADAEPRRDLLLHEFVVDGRLD